MIDGHLGQQPPQAPPQTYEGCQDVELKAMDHGSIAEQMQLARRHQGLDGDEGKLRHSPAQIAL